MEASALTSAGRSGLLARRSPLLRLQGDEKLVALIREGHDRAFEVLFDRYQGKLLGYCWHMVRSSPDAEDLMQEVFVAAHSAMLADERPINARPWLYRIARNRCLNHLRKPGADGQDSMDVHPHANGTTTLDRVQRREELRTIVTDIHELPETQRSALVMRELDGLGYTEIAQAMGISLASVKSLLVRARISLAEASEARGMACDDVRLELAEAAEGLGKLSGAARRHVKECPRCRRFRAEIRSTSRSLAGLAPVGLFAMLGKLTGLLGGGGSASPAGGTAGSAGGAGGAAGGGAGAAGAGTAGSVGAAGSVGTVGSVGGAAAAAGGSGLSLGGALGTVGGVVGAKAAVGVATAVLITAGAVGAQDLRSKAPVPQPEHATAIAAPTNTWSVEHSRAGSAAPTSATAPAAPHEVPAADEAAPPTETTTPTVPAPAPPAETTTTAPPDDSSTTATDDSGGGTDTSTPGDTTVGGSGSGGGTVTDPDPPPVTDPPTTDPPPDTDPPPPPPNPDPPPPPPDPTVNYGTGGTGAIG